MEPIDQDQDQQSMGEEVEIIEGPKGNSDPSNPRNSIIQEPNQDLLERNSEISQENKGLFEKNKTLNEGKVNPLNENKVLSNKHEKLQKDYENINEEKGKLQNDNTDLINKNQKLEKDIETINEKNIILQNDNRGLENKNKELEKDYENLSQEKGKLQNYNTVLNKKKEKLEKDIQTINEEKSVLENDNRGLESKNKELEKDYENLSQEKGKLQNYNTVLNNKNEKFEKDIQTINEEKNILQKEYQKYTELQSLINKGNELFLNHEYEDAINSFESTLHSQSEITNDDQKIDLNYKIGFSYFNLNQFEQANRYFLKVKDINNTDTKHTQAVQRSFERLGEQQAKKKNNVQAIENYKNALKNSNDEKDKQRIKKEITILESEIVQEEKESDNRQLGPDNLKLLKIANIYEIEGDIQAKTCEPNNSEMSKINMKNAITSYDKMIDLRDTYGKDKIYRAICLSKKANILDQQQNYGDAAYFYKEAHKLNPKEYQYLIKAAESLNQQGQKIAESAIGNVGQKKEIQPAIIAFNEAISLLNQVNQVSLNERKALFHYNMGYCYVKNSQLVEAMQKFQEAHELDNRRKYNQDWADALFYQAEEYLSKQKYDEAKQNYEKVAKDTSLNQVYLDFANKKIEEFKTCSIF